MKIHNWRRCEKPEVGRPLAHFDLHTQGFVLACSIVLGQDGRPHLVTPAGISFEDVATETRFADETWSHLNRGGRYLGSVLRSAAMLAEPGLKLHLNQTKI